MVEISLWVIVKTINKLVSSYVGVHFEKQDSGISKVCRVENSSGEFV